VAAASIDVKQRRAARVRDREIAPVWDGQFARSIARSLPELEAPFVLDVRPRTGRTTMALLDRYGDGTRILGIEEDAALIERAKERVPPARKSAVYFKPGNFDEVLHMARDTYDLVTANVVLGDTVPNWKDGLAELMRVAKPGGHVLATIPLRGTFAEVEDIFAEVLHSERLSAAARGLTRLRMLRPGVGDITKALSTAGLDRETFYVRGDRYRLLFASGRELLFSPVVEQGPLRLWQALLEKTPDPAKTFWNFRGAVDTYFADVAIAVRVLVGLVHIRVPGGEGPTLQAQRWRRMPALGSIFRGPPPSAIQSTLTPSPTPSLVDDDDDDDDLDLDIDLDDDLDDEDA
jgi:SAM-dependent methyltransferase